MRLSATSLCVVLLASAASADDARVIVPRPSQSAGYDVPVAWTIDATAIGAVTGHDTTLRWLQGPRLGLHKDRGWLRLGGDLGLLGGVSQTGTSAVNVASADLALDARGLAGLVYGPSQFRIAGYAFLAVRATSSARLRTVLDTTALSFVREASSRGGVGLEGRFRRSFVRIETAAGHAGLRLALFTAFSVGTAF